MSSSFTLKLYEHVLHLNRLGLGRSSGTFEVASSWGLSTRLEQCPALSIICTDLSNLKDLAIVTFKTTND